MITYTRYIKADISLLLKTDQLSVLRKGNYMCLTSSLLKIPLRTDLMLLITEAEFENEDVDSVPKFGKLLATWP